MLLEETEPPNQTLDHVLSWLEDSVSLSPLPGFDDSCLLHEFDGTQTWEWDQTQDPEHGFIQSYSQDLSAYVGFEATNLEVVTEAPSIDLDPPPELQQQNDQSRKRSRDEVIGAQQVKKSARSKRKAIKPSEKSSKDGNKEGRWAEKLLNPCALAITASNSSRVQHYLCVLSELASSSGDANRRLAAFGLRALQHHISSSSSVSSSFWPVFTFASSEVKMFQKTLLKFYEVSPWFALPNNMANSAILQILAQDSIDKKDLHILDIGVSHGMQWPTLLEALSCRPEGPPPRVRITVVSDLTADIPFSVGPPGYNYGSQLLGFARSLKINLQISVLDNFQLIDTSPHETLIVCVQFRLHPLNHSIPDERGETLKALRSLGPKGVVLCENNGECSASGDFAAGFSKKLEYLWKFLDSTSSGFKEENSEERKLMEGEATKVLMNTGEMNEGKDKWYERMREAGFAAEAFGEDAIDGAKSLLRKYDNNWEIRMEDGDTYAGLMWKGEAVSFCSLWK
ncbi:Transcription factor GRAS [Arabidopsis thaliana x Arabidopsis arenosa]|uniref:Transcription factor GRAS n=1 Tax=Arabidopsis thaliana x Arabidopsis arenosa TaxID=1240361 RepID=A0A8T2AWN3_9BRAS|nr:Transcription factor GRAS [Arabidopsis thaliana x Arabidopsis arenosa]